MTNFTQKNIVNTLNTPEDALLIHDKEHALPPRRKDVVLQGGGPVLRVHHVARLIVQVHDPLRELNEGKYWNRK